MTFMEALNKIQAFYPVKVLFNNIELFNDFDSIVSSTNEDGIEVFGETEHFLDVVPGRLWQYEHYRITSIKIEIVEFHHSIQYEFDYTDAVKSTVNGISGFEDAEVDVVQNENKIKSITIYTKGEKVLEKAEEDIKKEYVKKLLSTIYGVENIYFSE